MCSCWLRVATSLRNVSPLTDIGQVSRVQVDRQTRITLLSLCWEELYLQKLADANGGIFSLFIFKDSLNITEVIDEILFKKIKYRRKKTCSFPPSLFVKIWSMGKASDKILWKGEVVCAPQTTLLLYLLQLPASNLRFNSKYGVCYIWLTSQGMCVWKRWGGGAVWVTGEKCYASWLELLSCYV